MRTTKHFQSGFTLIELITSLTIMSVLSSIGIASFVTYSRVQTVTTATQDVITTLQLAKASALSQVKPNTCVPGPLRGYEVTIDDIPDPSTGLVSFAIAPVCAIPDTSAQKTTNLPKNALFQSNGTTNVFFHTVNGDVTVTPPSSTIVIQHAQDANVKKTITVETDGRIHVQ